MLTSVFPSSSLPQGKKGVAGLNAMAGGKKAKAKAAKLYTLRAKKGSLIAERDALLAAKTEVIIIDILFSFPPFSTHHIDHSNGITTITPPEPFSMSVPGADHRLKTAVFAHARALFLCLPLQLF